MGHNDNRDTLARGLFTRDPEEIMAYRFGLVSAFIKIKKVTWRRYAEAFAQPRDTTAA